MPRQAPRKGSSSRKVMTPALKAELGQVNFYAMKQADKKKKSAASRASVVPGSERSAARKKAQSKKKMTPALKAELGQTNFYGMKKAAEKKTAGRNKAGSEGPKRAPLYKKNVKKNAR